MLNVPFADSTFSTGRYFSGGLELYTVQGHGSDAWLRVPKFGTESQAIAGMYRE